MEEYLLDSKDIDIHYFRLAFWKRYCPCEERISFPVTILGKSPLKCDFNSPSVFYNKLK
jgi:hypothetical protein